MLSLSNEGSSNVNCESIFIMYFSVLSSRFCVALWYSMLMIVEDDAIVFLMLEEYYECLLAPLNVVDILA